MFKKYLSIFPKEVLAFLKKAVVLFFAWKALYILLLIPNEIPDALVVKKLGSASAFLLNQFYRTDNFDAEHIRKLKTYGNDEVWVTHSYVVQSGRKAIIGIYQACDGVELMVLTVGFIFCFVAPLSVKMLYTLLGLIGLFFINVLRCSLLGVVNLEYPQHFQFAHKYLFNIVVYAFTFFLWLDFVKRVKPKHHHIQSNQGGGS